jgi:hypothetical protein
MSKKRVLAKAEAEIDDAASGGTPTDRLFHYSSLQGIHGIIKTGSLWASDVAFLNDSRGLQHGLEMCQQAVAAMAKKFRAGRTP